MGISKAITVKGLSYFMWLLALLSAIVGVVSMSMVLLALAVVIFAVGIALQRPEFLLGFYISAMYIWGLLPTGLYERLTGLFLPLTALLSTVFLIVHYGIRFYRLTLHDSVLLIFSGYLLLGVLWSPAPNYGIFKALSFFLGTVFLFFLVFWVYREKPQALWRLVIVISLLGIVAFIFVFIASLSTGGFGPGTRSSRVYYLQNEMGIQYYALSNALQLGAICTFAMFFRRSRHLERWLWLGMFLAIGWAALALSQRAQLLGIALGCVILFVSRSRFRTWSRMRQRLNLRSIVLGVLLLLLFLVVLILGASKFSIEFMAQDVNILSRLELYRNAVQQFLASPWWGNGTGGFTEGAFGVDERIFAHNVFLDVLAEGGLIGTVLFLGVLYFIFLRARRLWRHDTSQSALGWIGLAVCVGRLVVSMFSADLASLNIGPWLAMLSIGVLAVATPDVVQPNCAAPDGTGDAASHSFPEPLSPYR